MVQMTPFPAEPNLDLPNPLLIAQQVRQNNLNRQVMQAKLANMPAQQRMALQKNQAMIAYENAMQKKISDQNAWLNAHPSARAGGNAAQISAIMSMSGDGNSQSASQNTGMIGSNTPQVPTNSAPLSIMGQNQGRLPQDGDSQSLSMFGISQQPTQPVGTMTQQPIGTGNLPQQNTGGNIPAVQIPITQTTTGSTSETPFDINSWATNKLSSMITPPMTVKSLGIKNTSPMQTQLINNMLATQQAKQTYAQTMGNPAAMSMRYGGTAHNAMTEAMWSGLGVEPSYTGQLTAKGIPLSEAANKMGLTVSQVIPRYPPTASTLNTMQRRAMAQAGLNTLETKVTAWVAPYSRTFAGFSPKQVWQAINNDSPDKQAEYLAGRALAPEIVILRNASQQTGSVGIEQMNETMGKAMINFQAFHGLVSSDIYIKTQNLIEGAIKESFNNEIRAVNNPYSLTNYQNKIFNNLVGTNATQNRQTLRKTFTNQQDFNTYRDSLSPAQKIQFHQSFGD